MGEDREMARLRWRCRRGMLELDLLLQRFLDLHYSQLSESEQNVFQALLQMEDSVLLAYVNGSQKCDDNKLENIIRKIQ